MLRRTPTVPATVGIALLGVAGAGAFTLAPVATSAPSSNLSAQARGSSKLASISGALDARKEAISRDYEREALKDAADQRAERTVEHQAAQRNEAVRVLAQRAEQRASEIAKNLWHLPTRGYHLTARFGSPGGLWSHDHTGLDFAAPSGTPIYAVATGVITKTGYDGAYGNKTVEKLSDGTELWYAHQASIGVHVGEHVDGGQTIGAVGSTGNTTGPHVHLEVRPRGGDPVDPYPALVVHGVKP